MSVANDWNEFKKTIQDYGFKIVMTRRFEDKRGEKPEFIIAAHPEKFLLLCATSYVTKTAEVINGGTVYGTIKASDNLSDEQVMSLSLCSTGLTPFGLRLEFDLFNRLFDKLSVLEKAFGGFIKWNDPDPLLNLLDYTQYGTASETGERDKLLSSAPDWVRDFILPDEEHIKSYNSRSKKRE